MSKTHLLIANTEFYNLKEMKEDIDKEGYVYWHLSKNDGTNIHQIYSGDMCYIYFANLPDFTSRIIFKAEVKESDLENKNNKSINLKADGKTKYIKLVNFKSIALYEINKFSRDNLVIEYGIGKTKDYHINFRGDYRNIEDNKKILKDLSNYHGGKFDVAFNYFEDFTACELGNNHKTFIKNNGFQYIEGHHLIEKNLIEKYNIDNIKNLIDNRNNLFSLCPNCHRQMHYGIHKIVREKLKYLYEKDDKKKEYIDMLAQKIANRKDTLNWLYEIYHVEND